MKKKFVGLLSIFLVIVMVTFVFAEQNIIVKLTVGSKNATVNGKPITLDVPPIVQNGRTLVPLRFISEAFGAKIDWDSKTRSITITMADIESLKAEINSLNSQIDSIKASYESKIAELNKEIENLQRSVEDKSATIAEKEEEIERLKADYEGRIKALEDKIKELEDEVSRLKEELSKVGGKEENPPKISISNLVDGQTITEKVAISGKIEDENFIAFVRVKLGSFLILEGKEIGGEIDPVNFASGEYKLSIEAIDSFGNKGLSEIKVNIKNDEKKEPVKLSLNAMDTPVSEKESMPILFVQIVNNGLSNLEVLKVDTFDKQGNPFLIQGMNLFDLVKMQMGLEHLWLHSKEKIMIPAALDMQNTGKKAKELFKDYKVVITFYDSIMEREFVREITLKG